MIELLSPVGDFECLKAAVQNGADAVYFGASSFSARAFATNFSDDTLEKAINYAKVRGVKTNLTLNTLIQNNELEEAFNLAKKAYEYGIDAIIVQDLGLAKLLIDNFLDLDIHASTQMSVHNLEGVKHLESLGFKRVVLSRELPASEIEYICKHSNIEIECFVHGALCVSYSGQCLFSSSIGARSGNRGSCAQPCRLPYTLLESTSLENQNRLEKSALLENNNLANSNLQKTKTTQLDAGYLLSTRDLCGLEYLPQLISSGVSSLKIEGRMKSPEYVATVTRIYRKYIDIIQNNPALFANGKKLEITLQDKKDLMQVFNRGGFSDGHLSSAENKSLIFSSKPNNMGIYLGEISNFNNNKGYISLKLSEKIEIGDKICVQTKSGDENYTVSEIIVNNKNFPMADAGTSVKIGRMKGSLQVGNKVYKMTSKKLLDEASKTFINSPEIKKIPLYCGITVKKNKPVEISVFDQKGTKINIISEIYPVDAINSPITKERLIAQISKTNNTPFEFKNISINLDDGLYIPSISSLNELRRNALAEYENKLIDSFKRTSSASIPSYDNFRVFKGSYKISLLLNTLNNNFSYNNLKGVDRIYVPLKYWVNPQFSDVLSCITSKFDTYIYLPCIMRNNYLNLFKNNINNILNMYNVKGFVISNIGQFELVKIFKNNYDFIANYTLNLFNSETANNLDVSTVTVSPELNKMVISDLCVSKTKEFIVYGKLPLMNSNYCLLGKSNKCYKNCDRKCMNGNSYYLKDRLGLLFKVIPDYIDTVTTIYNSKTTSISMEGLNCDFARIDVLDESIFEINDIISNVLAGKKLEGSDYTNGNLNKNV